MADEIWRNPVGTTFSSRELGTFQNVPSVESDFTTDKDHPFGFPQPSLNTKEEVTNSGGVLKPVDPNKDAVPSLDSPSEDSSFPHSLSIAEDPSHQVIAIRSREGFVDPIQPLTAERRAFLETLPAKERAEVAYVRRFIVANPEKSDPDTWDGLDYFMDWGMDPETKLHLVPAPPEPLRDTSDSEAYKKQRVEYLETFNPDFTDVDPKKKTKYGELDDVHPKLLPFVAVNNFGEPIAVEKARIAKDLYIQSQGKYRTPVIEGLIVNPDLQHHGIGTNLTASVIEYLFTEFKGYKDPDSQKPNLPAKSIYAWIMCTGNWSPNWWFFRKLGFKTTSRNWREEAIKNSEPGDEKAYEEDAILFKLDPKSWSDAKKINKKIKVYGTIQESEALNTDERR